MLRFNTRLGTWECKNLTWRRTRLGAWECLSLRNDWTAVGPTIARTLFDRGYRVYVK